MNGDVEGVAPRPRPLSGGLWTLFSWLRRDERASSNESLSSVGSDRTAASFAFLAPANYSINNSPVLLPPPSPPTNSYKKRVQERNVRRQYERDITLHRKYGLYRSDGSAGYDAFSLPPARKLEGDISCKWERDRRATSECCQRRALHVPGKRRAPLPPIRASLESTGTHPRGRRKRRAPPPPIKVNKENEVAKEKSIISIPMNSQIIREETLQNCGVTTTNTSEKCRKKESGSKDAKNRPEKSFLKNIFENRKRNSAVDTSAVKILPSISELDKQAANIIENEKLRKQNLNESDMQHRQSSLDNCNKKTKADSWFCIKCLRKYDSSVSECPYCIFEKVNTPVDIHKTDAKTNASDTQTQTDSRVISQILSSKYKNEEKQKLKEMLKEMKDSLPKRSKHDHRELITSKKNNLLDSSYGQKDSVSETPTLRIGTSINNSNITSSFSKPSTSGINKNSNILKSATPLESFQNVIATQPVVINHEIKRDLDERNGQNSTPNQNNLHKNCTDGNIFKRTSPSVVNVQKIENNLVNAGNENKSLQTPLRISSLLNPVYIPKNDSSKPVTSQNKLHTEVKKSDTNVAQIDANSASLILTKPDIIISNKPKSSSSSTSYQTDIKKADLIDKNRDLISSINGVVQQNSSLPTNDNNITKSAKDLTKLSSQPNNKSNEALPSTSTDVAANDLKIKSFHKDGLNQHIKRRELINQLEKSIANGDEHAAAEAAIKLAQLRLSCSVLSFSSQIISEPSTSSSSTVITETSNVLELSNKENTKVTSNISAINNVIVNDKELLPVTNTVITAIASSSQEKSVKQNEVKLSNYSENAKSVPTVIKKTSEILTHSTINNDKTTQNSASDEVTARDKENTEALISVWVEDKEATRGPIKLKTQRHANVGELRRQAQTALGLPCHLQRWIVGRTLCTDDTTPLVTVAGPEFNAPFYLCLVETEQQPAAGTSKQVKDETTNLNNKGDNNVYKELVELEQQALVHNAEVFECGVCIEECQPGNGVILRECVHMFCKDCLADVVRHSGEPDISCPAMGCRGILQEREIRGLVTPEDYERWLARGLAAAESGTRNAFHCRTKDCTGWALCDPGVRKFLCPVCKHSNCVPCQAIHEGETCEKYRERLQAVSNQNSNQSDDSTRALLNNLINKGEALECPECKAIITKMWGCDWVKCSACKTEICWVTRGRRWGPAGRGDTSAGCRCGVDGKRCHPSCGYCH